MEIDLGTNNHKKGHVSLKHRYIIKVEGYSIHRRACTPSTTKILNIKKITKRVCYRSGRWDSNEKKLYSHFLRMKDCHPSWKIKLSHKKRVRYFKEMSRFIKTRSPQQCRSHDQKVWRHYAKDHQDLISEIKLEESELQDTICTGVREEQQEQQSLTIPDQCMMMSSVLKREESDILSLKLELFRTNISHLRKELILLSRKLSVGNE